MGKSTYTTKYGINDVLKSNIDILVGESDRMDKGTSVQVRSVIIEDDHEEGKTVTYGMVYPCPKSSHNFLMFKLGEPIVDELFDLQ